MLFRLVAAGLMAALVFAGDKKIEPARAADENVDLTGTALIGRQQVKAALGIDPEVEMIAIEIKVRPKTDAGVKISRDDFVLISRNDGQRSAALHPSQIAGSGSLKVATRDAGASGGMVGPRRGPIWGGVPGTGTRPRRLGGDSDIPAGIADAETKTSINDGHPDDGPVLTALKQKELVQTKTVEPVSGYLYYIFDGKHKLKDLELMYKTPGGNTLTLDFQK